MKRAANPARDARAARGSFAASRVQLGTKRKTVGPDLAHGSWFPWRAVLPPVGYLEVGTNLPRRATPSGATLRRASIVVLSITHTSGNDNQRRSVGRRSLRGD